MSANGACRRLSTYCSTAWPKLLDTALNMIKIVQHGEAKSLVERHGAIEIATINIDVIEADEIHWKIPRQKEKNRGQYASTLSNVLERCASHRFLSLF